MLQVDGLEKSYATRDGTVQAVRGVSFTIPAGRFFTLLGPSGCGKTTTLRCVAGLERPGAGRITMNGAVLADAADGTFVPAIQELSASILLFSSGSITLAVAVYNLYETGYTEPVAALAIINVVIIAAAIWIARKIGGERPLSENAS